MLLSLLLIVSTIWRTLATSTCDSPPLLNYKIVQGYQGGSELLEDVCIQKVLIALPLFFLLALSLNILPPLSKLQDGSLVLYKDGAQPPLFPRTISRFNEYIKNEHAQKKIFNDTSVIEGEPCKHDPLLFRLATAEEKANSKNLHPGIV